MAGEQFELWGTCFLKAQEILGGDLDGLAKWAGLAKTELGGSFLHRSWPFTFIQGVQA